MSEVDFKEMIDAEKQEMERYRWTESERVGYDVGKPIYLDWIMKYAGDWRTNWDKLHPKD